MIEYSHHHIHELRLSDFPKGEISKTWLHIINNGIGDAVRIPLFIAKGVEDGPVLGITAALHGNELNGIPVIQRFFRELDPASLRGTIIGVLVSNVPGLLLEQRKFNDGVDLNRIAPGAPNGNQSQVYINRLIQRIVRHFEYHLDLHTASFGRINSFYIRADMSDPYSSRMARLQNPDIILHNPPNDHTLRGNAAALGIKAITVELKDPHIFQRDVIAEGIIGIKNVLYDLKMLEGTAVCPIDETILCNKSYWIYTDEGGILTVKPKIAEEVKKGDLIAQTTTIFGDVVKKYYAPEDGIIIGKSVNPINQTGSRIIHLGIDYKRIPCVLED